jgi:toxin CptA
MQDIALTFTIRPSNRLRLAMAALHALAAGAVSLADLAGWLILATLVALAGHLAWALGRVRPAALRCQADGSLHVLAGGDWLAAELLPDTAVLAWLVVLRYRMVGGAGRHAVVVLPDSLETDAFRRLRVWLRWRARLAGQVEPGQA